jgi:hypothetical protein
MSTDFWDYLTKEADLSGGGTGSVDSYLSGKPIGGEQFTSVRQLTDRERSKQAIQLPVEAGTRVAFAGNLGAVLAYDNPPEPKAQGTVVSVKSAHGSVTSHEGKVFVQWDDGSVMPIHAEHLRLAGKGRVKRQAAHRMRVASLGDLTDFLKVSNDTLIHRSNRDLWSFRRDGPEYVIERLFDDQGEPLKG